MNPPQISIIVPSYNVAAYLRPFCESVQAQTFKDFEVLIGDDGSKDNSIEVLQPYLKDPRFRLFQWKPNRGVHPGTVFLFNQARGQFWCNPGADDVLEPVFLEKRLHKLASRPEAMMVHGPGHWINEHGQPYKDDYTERALPLLTTRMPEAVPADRMLRLLLQHNFVNIPSVMVRMDVTRQILPFFAPYWQWALDWYLWILLAATGLDTLWDAERLHQYRVHSASNSVSPEKETLRRTERKLVPLCALQTAATFSPIARAVWVEERVHLYRWWLASAARLYRKGQLQKRSLLLAANAFKGSTRVSLPGELLGNGLGVLLQYQKEHALRRQQLFPVSGLSLMDDPLFRP